MIKRLKKKNIGIVSCLIFRTAECCCYRPPHAVEYPGIGGGGGGTGYKAKQNRPINTTKVFTSGTPLLNMNGSKQDNWTTFCLVTFFLVGEGLGLQVRSPSSPI